MRTEFSLWVFIPANSLELESTTSTMSNTPVSEEAYPSNSSYFVANMTEFDEGSLDNTNTTGTFIVSVATDVTNCSVFNTSHCQTNPPPPQSQLEFYLGATHTVVTGILMVFGLIFNLLSLILWCQPSLRRLPLSVYIIFLCVTDTFNLWWFNSYTWFLKVFHSAMPGPVRLCNVRFYMSFVGASTSTWLLVMLTIERLVAVWRPLRAKLWNSHIRATYLSLGLLVILALLFLPVLWSYNEDCSVKSQMSSYVLHILSLKTLLVISIIPDSILICGNIRLLLAVRQSVRTMDDINGSQRRRSECETSTSGGNGTTLAEKGPPLAGGKLPNGSVKQGTPGSDVLNIRYRVSWRKTQATIGAQGRAATPDAGGTMISTENKTTEDTEQSPGENVTENATLSLDAMSKLRPSAHRIDINIDNTGSTGTIVSECGTLRSTDDGVSCSAVQLDPVTESQSSPSAPAPPGGGVTRGHTTGKKSFTVHHPVPRLVAMTLGVTCAHLALTLPETGIYIYMGVRYRYQQDLKPPAVTWTWSYLSLLLMVNYSINFFIYYCNASLFKLQFQNMIKKFASQCCRSKWHVKYDTWLFDSTHA